MNKPKFELSDVIDRFYSRINTASLTTHHKRTLEALAKCRTAALGGHVDKCEQCHHIKVSYNSCRNRHCPKCQGVEKEMWIIQQEEALLPISYYHVVFTLPHELNGLCRHNPAFMYDLLMRSAWNTLQQFALDEKWLGAKSAATMVLHTWSQTLVLHPHVHCIVPNGGLTKQGKWQFPKRGKDNFLFPVIAMQSVFRALFMTELHQAICDGLLVLPKDFPFRNPYYNWKNELYKKDWVVFTKKPFSGPSNVVKYLARYSHRVTITNQRIIAIDNQHVTFSYKDYNDGAKHKVMTLSGEEFLRRFVLHIVPLGFRKIRQYGYLSNASRKKSLLLARLSLKAKMIELSTKHQRKQKALLRLFGISGPFKSCCKCGSDKITSDIILPNKDPPNCKSKMKDIIVE